MARTKSKPGRRSTAVAAAAKSKEAMPDGLSAEDLVDFFTRMVYVRTTDERLWALNRQGKVPIAASSQGHEAAQLGSLLAAAKDWKCFLFPYYRDLALKMAAGLTPTQVMLSFMGKDGEPYSNARQFPLQGADLPRHIIQISNVVGAGLTQSVGYALGCRMLVDDTVTVAVQVNGKLRATLELDRDIDDAAAEAAALADSGVARAIGDKPVRRVIVVPNRIVNVVV